MLIVALALLATAAVVQYGPDLAELLMPEPLLVDASASLWAFPPAEAAALEPGVAEPADDQVPVAASRAPSPTTWRVLRGQRRC